LAKIAAMPRRGTPGRRALKILSVPLIRRVARPGAAVFVAAWAMTGPAAAEGDRALGEYLSHECVSCHQISGHSTGAIPSIVGLPADHFIDTIRQYREKKRESVVMQTILGRLSDAEIAALAAYFGSLKPASKP